MKKKILFPLSYCIVAVVFCLVGILIGSNINKENKSNEKVLGVFYFDSKDETLSLKADSKCTMRPYWMK